MNWLKLTTLLLILVLGMTSVNAQESQANIAITLERTPCFGACPVYTVTILQDGTVIYEGTDFVTVAGEQTSQITPETVEVMVEAFENAGYFEWNAEYTDQNVTDLPSVTTSVTRDGETHQITHYTGDYSAPLVLSFLENWIDEMVGTAAWTGYQQDIAAISNGTTTPFVTLQRTACFGMCPVYSVAMYEDGTVVYTGTAHVDNIGVHIFEADPVALTSIAERAESFGYFNWQDSYDVQFMTDQATTTTSIQWADQFKRIVRYGGDPNAPVGLVWVEDIIDQTVTELMS
jgi:NADH:ubiquinone oxidoreductase subunit E